MSGAVDRVIGINVRFVARHEVPVLLLARDLLLKLRKNRSEAVKHLGTLEILQKHIGLVGGLESKETVVIDLVRADDEIHLAVRHLKPRQIAVVVVVGLEGVDLLEKIVAHARLDGDVSRRLKVVADLVNVVLEGIMVPDRGQPAVRSAPYEGIRTRLHRVVHRLELGGRHVLRIEVGAKRTLGSETIDERLAVKTVPRAVIDFGIFLQISVFQVLDQHLVTEALLPVDAVGLIRREFVEIKDFFAVVSDAGKVRRLDLHERVRIDFLLDSGLGLCVT